MTDVLYTGGVIRTMTGRAAEAVLTRGERIEFVGGLREARARAASSLDVVDLRGRTLLPAFPDAHSHLVSFSQTLRLVPLQGVHSFDELIAVLKAHIAHSHVPDGAWVMGFGYEQNAMQERQHPTKEVLDKVSTTHPVMVTQMSGHMGALNSLALRLAGIDSNTPDPQGGRIGRERDGRTPNGYLEEKAFMAAGAKVPPVGMEESLALLEKAQEIYLKNGITTVQEGLVKEGEWKILKQAARAGRLKVDVVAYTDWNACPALYLDTHEDRVYNGNLRMGGAKIFLDGSPQSRTAWMSAPYENSTETGYPIYNDATVLRLLRSAHDAGAQLLAHCNGDAACEQFIRAAEQVYQPGDDARPVMIHAQTVTAAQLLRMKPLGMIPSFFVSHVKHFGDVHLQNLGQRAQTISPCGTAERLNLPYTFHMDTPVLPPNLMDALDSACRRETASGAVLGPAERITPMQGLAALTRHAAYQYFEEGSKGTLEAGKRADLVLLSQDPCQARDIASIRVECTVLRGKMCEFPAIPS